MELSPLLKKSLEQLGLSMRSQLGLSQAKKLPSKLAYQIVEVFRFYL